MPNTRHIELNALKVAPIDFGTAAAHDLVAAVAGRPIRIYQILIISAGAQTLQFLDGSTALTGLMTLATGIPLFMPYTGFPHYQTAAGAAFVGTNSAGTQFSGTVWYTDDPLDELAVV